MDCEWGRGEYGPAHVWNPKNNLRKLVFSFCHMGPQDQTQAIRLGNKHLYFLRCGVGPRIINFYKCLFQTFLVTVKNHLRQVMELSNIHL